MSLLYIIRLFELFLILFFQRERKKTALFQRGKKYLNFLLQKSRLPVTATSQAGLVRRYQHLCITKLRISTDLGAYLGCMHPNFSRQHLSLKVQNIYQLESQPKAFIYNQKFNKLLIYYRVNTSSTAEQSMFNIQDLSAMLSCPLH